MRGVFLLSLAASVAAAPAFSVGTIHDGAAPILSSSNADEIPNSYIVKFKDHVTESSATDHHSWVQKIHLEGEDERLELRKRGLIRVVDDVFRGLKHTYKIGRGFLGYSGHFDDAVIEQVRRHPDVSPFPCHTILPQLPSSDYPATPLGFLFPAITHEGPHPWWPPRARPCNAAYLEPVTDRLFLGRVHPP